MKLRLTPALIAAILILTAIPADADSSGIDRETYAARRQTLMQKMGDGIAVFRNPPEATRTNDVNYYPYRPGSNFFYLSGFGEPEAAFLLVPGGEKEFIMFVRPENASSSQWYGDVPGIGGAMELYGADTAYPVGEFETVLRRLLFRTETVWFDIGDEELRDFITPLLPGFHGYGPEAMRDVARIVDDMRIVKDPAEIALIREAVRISCEGHLEAMKAIVPGMYEYEIAAIFSHVFERSGSRSKAYEAIVASGPASTIYHYSDIGRRVEDGDVVLMDMGAEWKNYAADITRMVPANGRFTGEQKRLYELVVQMEDSMIARMKPGADWNEVLKLTEPIAKRGLHELGLITDPESPWQHLLYYYPYCGHGVGLDVHDVGNYGEYGRWGRILEPGMVFAIEPLLYVGDNLIPAFRQNVARRFQVPEDEIEAFLRDIRPAFDRYRNIAARVEDDVLITPDGNEVLSSSLPRTVDEIERVMSEPAPAGSR